MRFKIIASLVLLLACSSSSIQADGTDTDDRKIYQELSGSLQNNLLDSWYPRTIDSISVGFLSIF